MYTTLKQARKHLEPKDFRQIHKNAEQAVKELKTKETEVIKALQEVDSNKVYRYLGLNSLYQYALAIGLSEHQAYTYITVARKALECNQLQKAIESKEITVSKARRLAAVMDKKNQRSWLSLAGKLSKRELEKEIAKTNPRAIAPEQAKYLTQDVLELSLPVSEEVYNQLKRVQDILCQKNQKTVSLEECLKTLCEFYLDKQDPVRKAKRIIGKKSAKARMESNSTKANAERVLAQPIVDKFNSARAEKGEKR